MSSIRSPIDSFDNYENDTKEELTKPIHMTFVVGSEQEPNTSYLPKPIAISSPPIRPESQERLPSQTGEMVTLLVPGVQSRLRSQPPTESQSPTESQPPAESQPPEESPPRTMEQLQMMQQRLDPIESHLGTSSMISGDSVDSPVDSYDLFFDVNGLVNDPHYGDLRPTSTCVSGDSQGSNESYPYSPGTEETVN